MAPRFTRADYTVGWICALPVELAAAQEMLDEEHESLALDVADVDIYTFGRIGDHNVAVACLPAGQTGTNSAAAVAMRMKASLHSIRFGLMVGIGGGVPSADADVRLGDVVVSQPGGGHGGVIQYDFGKVTPDRIERTGFLNAPPPLLLGAVARVRANDVRGRSKLGEYIAQLGAVAKFERKKAGPDVLFKATYNHAGGLTCQSCDTAETVQREDDREEDVVVHYGTIASGNMVMRDAKQRDTVSSEFGGVLCFEMEAAGLMNSFPCLAIRGICDYADSHKNKKWQPYAAGTAAAYAKELLLVIPVAEVAKAPTAAEATQESKAPASYLPYTKNQHYVGRIKEREALERKLFTGQGGSKAAIFGLGGIGKTQVALDFAFSVLEQHPQSAVFWVSAISAAIFQQSLQEIARLLGIGQESESSQDVGREVQRHLSSTDSGNWLLIIDNIDDMEMLYGISGSEGIYDWLPKSLLGSMLFTTRNREVAQSLVGSDVIEVLEMDQRESLDLLKQSLMTRELLDDQTAAKLLLEELGYLPLAITQAAAYINVNTLPCSEYLGLLHGTDEDMVELFSKEMRDSTRDRQAASAVATTWIVSFRQILRQDEIAGELLQFISCIEWKAIPHSMLPAAGTIARTTRAIGTLCSYSFLTRRIGQKMYDMHRLVHLAVRIWLNQQGQIGVAVNEAVKHLVDVFPSDEWDNRQMWRAYLPHAQHLRKVSSEQDDDGDDDIAELCLSVGKCLQVDGKNKDAVSWLEESCMHRAKLQQEDPHRLLSEQQLAMAYLANVHPREALKLLERVVQMGTEVLGEGHPTRLALENIIAITYMANGQTMEAVEIQECVVKLKSEVLAEDRPSRLASEHKFAIANRTKDQIREAVEILEQVVQVQTEMLVVHHPHRLALEGGLAVAYLANNQIREALELLEHVVQVQTEVLCEDHPNRLTSQQTLAKAYLANGRIREGLELTEHVVKVQKEVLCEDHPSRLASEHVLARVYGVQGRLDEAINLWKHVVSVQGSLREDHIDRLAAQHELGKMYAEQGQLDEAIKLLEQVVKVKQRSLTEDHPNRLTSQHEFGRMYATNGTLDDAIKLIEYVDKIKNSVLEEGNSYRVQSEELLAKLKEEKIEADQKGPSIHM